MTNYWLCIMRHENWWVVQKKGIWGVTSRNVGTLNKIKKGDMLVFYVTPKKIGGIFEADSNPFSNQEQIFEWGDFGKLEIFPHRIKIKKLIIPNELVSVDSIVSELDFVKSDNFGIYVRRTIQPISLHDFKIFEKACKQTMCE